ncbi:molybdopterin-containing oxidoreductase family protein [Sedimenticola selenatireducens]|uniref:molybdopterin-containing oxidoreductase family protein n=1 Tax=Sedimenticola selenatireducens TaxID=191960 RepID=UPI003F4AD565
MEKRVPGYCALCISRCGCISTVRDGRLVAVDPDPDHPTGEHLCIKGRTAPEWVNSSERLLTPLKRTRAKGAADPGWQPIGWDEALETISQRLQQLAASAGPESVAFSVTTPSGTGIADSFNWINRLAHAYGSPNTVFATENCNWHKDFTPMHTWGGGIGMPDYERTGCILLWGFNPTTSWLAQANLVRQAKRRGARLVVIDCRRAGLAALADQWLRVRPGSDGPLAMSLAHVLIENGWYDQAFIRRWSNGPFLVRGDNGRLLTEADIRPGGSSQRYVQWDERRNAPLITDSATSDDASVAGDAALFGSYPVTTLQGRILCSPVFQHYAERCREYAPEAQSAITGISAEQVRETARLLHEQGPVSYFTWTGTAQQPQASQTSRAISLLYALTGDFDAPGGNVYFAKPAVANFFGLELLDQAQRQKTLGFRERPVGPGTMGWITSLDLYRAVVEQVPYPVKALISFGSNPQLTKPPTAHTEAALKQLEFYVHADLFMNPTAVYADIILPVASPWERSGLYPGFQVSQRAESHLQLRPAVIPPRGEAQSDTWIVFQLAVRLGLADHFFGGDMQQALEKLLEPSGVALETLQQHPQGIDLALQTQYQKYRQQGFATPSGRLELYASRFEAAGHDPLPDFVSGSDRDAAYPLRLTSAKWVQYCHSQQRNVPSLRKRMPDPLVELHPDTAVNGGIAEGEWVVVATPQGSIRARARFNESLDRNVVCAQYGWWQAGDGLGGRHYNGLIDAEEIDPVSGSNSLRSARCRISKIAPGE